MNNNTSPVNGPASCPWTRLNCGSNEETFSFHTGGAFAAFCDGGVRFLSDNLAGSVYRALLSINGREPVSDGG